MSFTHPLTTPHSRYLRKITQDKGIFPTDDSVRKLLCLAHRDIAHKLNMPIPDLAMILNQSAISVQGRF